jgi:F0F1-type ATP synthase assembly protein I
MALEANMDNLITGIIAVGIFLAFVLGLAVSIGTIPFGIIVVIVSGMIVTDFYQSAKEGFNEENE